LIDKFNFYDVYGYFLPGAALLAVLWIPLGLMRKAWPPADWSSAIISAAVAYILGHLLQNVATNAIPSARKERYPSEIYLDHDNTELPQPLKTKIAYFVQQQFGLYLQIDKNGPGDEKSIDKVRNNAFLCARQTLIQGKSVSYAEQFQGMYALTRGLFSVLALGSAYWLGWAAGTVRSPWLINAAIIVSTVTLLALAIIPVVVRLVVSKPIAGRRIELGYACLLLLAFLVTGYLLSLRYQTPATESALLVFLAAGALIGCVRAYGAYKSFAGRFASTVWRDYLVYNVKPQSPAPEK